MRPLKIAIPNKGRLSDDALATLQQAGLQVRGSTDRKLMAYALDGRVQILFVRAKDIPTFVANGAVDAGITGADVIAESGETVDDRLDLGFGNCKLVTAVPSESPATSDADLPDGARIATSFPVITAKHFAALGKQVRILPVSGACEIMPALGVADAIVDITSSGSTLLMNHLRVIGDVMASSCRFITAKVDPAVQTELERVLFALESVLSSKGKRYLMADIPRAAIAEIKSFLPGLAGPTIVEIDDQTAAMQVVVDEASIFDAVHRLKQLGATGILVTPIERMVA
ncbi:MAG: ATP phosphoribosyltransferase [Thermoplasmatota archaeon]